MSCPAAYPSSASTAERLRTYAQGVTLSFRIEPSQAVYAAPNVVTGYTRPYHGTESWRSAPGTPEDAWLRLDWDEPVAVKTIELTFPGQLLREYHAYPPGYRDPQTARDYVLEGSLDGTTWDVLAEVTDNYRRKRRHVLETPVASTRPAMAATTTGGPAKAASSTRS